MFYLQRATISCLLFSMLHKHLPRVKAGFLNMEIFLAVKNIAVDILWTVIPCFVELMNNELINHICFVGPIAGTDLHLVFSFSFSSSHLALLLLSPTSTCPRPAYPYIFWKLMIIAIQKRIGNTNTKTKTNTKTMTKTKTQREQLNHYQCAIFS